MEEGRETDGEREREGARAAGPCAPSAGAWRGAPERGRREVGGDGRKEGDGGREGDGRRKEGGKERRRKGGRRREGDGGREGGAEGGRVG